MAFVNECVSVADAQAYAAPQPWVAHSPRVFSVPGLLLASECAALIELAEQRGFGEATVRTDAGPQFMRNVRNNERAQFESPEWIDLVWRRMAAMPLPALEGQVALGLPKQLRFYKYSPGQRFRMHKDGPWHEGAAVTEGVKYVLRSDVMYGVP